LRRDRLRPPARWYTPPLTGLRNLPAVAVGHHVKGLLTARSCPFGHEASEWSVDVLQRAFEGVGVFVEDIRRLTAFVLPLPDVLDQLLLHEGLPAGSAFEEGACISHVRGVDRVARTEGVNAIQGFLVATALKRGSECL